MNYNSDTTAPTNVDQKEVIKEILLALEPFGLDDILSIYKTVGEKIIEEAESKSEELEKQVQGLNHFAKKMRTLNGTVKTEAHKQDGFKNIYKEKKQGN